MKKYFSGVLTGCIIGLILATTTFAFGADPIKLVVNGKNIDFPDAPPQIVNGRTMVPARPLAEALGANVAWDDANRTVVVTGGVYTDGTPTDLPALSKDVPAAPNKNPAATNGPVTLKVNGKDTSIEQWQELNGDLYVPGRVILEFLSKKHSDPNASLGADGSLVVLGKSHKLDTTIFDKIYTLYSLNSLAKTGLASYQWDPTTANVNLQ